MTRHIATLSVTDSNNAVHDLVIIEAERDHLDLLPEVYTVTRFDSNGKRQWRFSGHGASDEAIPFALKMAAFGDFKRDYYDES